MFRSKVREAARAAGVGLEFARDADAVLAAARRGGVSRIVVDLADERLDVPALLRGLRADAEAAAVPVVGFFPHVRADVRESALAAGCDVVLPRSAFSARLPDVLAGRYPAAGDRESR
jgi:CheY-like chemotaxis protein